MHVRMHSYELRRERLKIPPEAGVRGKEDQQKGEANAPSPFRHRRTRLRRKSSPRRGEDIAPEGQARLRRASVRLEGTYGNQKYMQDRTVIC